MKKNTERYINEMLCNMLEHSLGIPSKKYDLIFTYKYKETSKIISYALCFGEGYFSVVEFSKKDLLNWSGFIN